MYYLTSISKKNYRATIVAFLRQKKEARVSREPLFFILVCCLLFVVCRYCCLLLQVSVLEAVVCPGAVVDHALNARLDHPGFNWVVEWGNPLFFQQDLFSLGQFLEAGAG